ncbi:MAG: hypothetical protein P8020_07655 [Acidobacteriota bacterium]|jgi:hypothetical protein
MRLGSMLPEVVRDRIPPIGSDLVTPLRETLIHARFYDRSTDWQWFVLEMDGDDECFGIVVSRVGAVAGRFTLTELEGLRSPRGEVGAVVLDTGFEPRTVGRLAEREPAVRELLEASSPRERHAAEGLVDLE